MPDRGRVDAPRGRTRDVFRYFFRAYPGRSSLMIALMVGAGLAEGVGVVALIPIVQLAESDGAPQGRLADLTTGLLQAVGLPVTLVTLLALVVFTIAVKAALLFAAQRQVGYTVAGVVRDFRLDLMRNLLGARWSYFVRRTPGQFANAVAFEARQSAVAYQQACLSMAISLRVAAYLTVAFLVSWMVALASIVVGATLILLAGRFFELSRASGRKFTTSSRALASRLVDVLQGVKALKAMGKERLVWPLLEHETQLLNQASRQEILSVQSLRSMQEPVMALALAIGLYSVLELTGLPLADALVMGFVFYRLVAHVNALNMSHQAMLVGEAAFFSFRTELATVRGQSEEWPGTLRRTGVENEIRLTDVTFAYDEEPILRGVDAVFPARSHTAIHGESGVGKTTLGDLLAGLLRPTRGEIAVDGTPLMELDLAAWREGIGYVPQETLLFNESVLDNVTLGDARYDSDDAREALELAGAWQFVQARDGGLDAPLGERGALLSGGQRQRIALARALVGGPSLLILDEVTTGLDPATEAGICETLRRLSQSMTIVSISHQPALREIADRVYVMKDGKLEPAASPVAGPAGPIT